MRPVLLVRASEDTDGEAAVAASYLPVYTDVSDVCLGDLVVGRFSLFPFYDWIQSELQSRGAELLVSYEDYQYIADMRNWYDVLSDVTPRTWFGGSVAAIPPEYSGPFFVKGVANSRKSTWSNAYARDRVDLTRVLAELSEDPFISQQVIAIRDWVPLHTLFSKANGQPVTEEYRFFILDGEVLSAGYYWASKVQRVMETGFRPDPSRVDPIWLNDVISRIPVRHYVLDVGVTETGGLVVVELNDPSMSGLCGNDPHALYANLAARLQ
jgi:hypothetical protein